MGILFEDINKNLDILKQSETNESKEQRQDPLRKSQELSILDLANKISEGKVPDVGKDNIEGIIKTLIEKAIKEEDEADIEKKEDKIYFGSAGENLYYAQIDKAGEGAETEQEPAVQKITLFDVTDEIVSTIENKDGLSTAEIVYQAVQSLNMDSVSFRMLDDLDLLKKPEEEEKPTAPEGAIDTEMKPEVAEEPAKEEEEEEELGKEPEEMDARKVESTTEKEKWMQKAFAKHKGGLHKALGMPEDKEISVEDMRKAYHSSDAHVKKMAVAAVNANPDKYGSIKEGRVDPAMRNKIIQRTTRKPLDWEEAEGDMVEAMDYKGYVDKLPVFDLTGTQPTEDFKDQEKIGGQPFVAKVDNNYFYVDPQGYTYARYTVKLLNFKPVTQEAGQDAHMFEKELPKVQHAGKEYFVDNQLQQIRAVDNQNETIDFDDLDQETLDKVIEIIMAESAREFIGMDPAQKANEAKRWNDPVNPSTVKIIRSVDDNGKTLYIAHDKKDNGLVGRYSPEDMEKVFGKGWEKYPVDESTIKETKQTKKDLAAAAERTKSALSFLRKIHKTVEAGALETIMDAIEKAGVKGDIDDKQEDRLKSALTRRKEALAANPKAPEAEPTKEEEKDVEASEGKEEAGKRDGTGPYKDSMQRQQTGDVGKRKMAGEKCPNEAAGKPPAVGDPVKFEHNIGKIVSAGAGKIGIEIGDEGGGFKKGEIVYKGQDELKRDEANNQWMVGIAVTEAVKIKEAKEKEYNDKLQELTQRYQDEKITQAEYLAAQEELKKEYEAEQQGTPEIKNPKDVEAREKAKDAQIQKESVDDEVKELEQDYKAAIERGDNEGALKIQTRLDGLKKNEAKTDVAAYVLKIGTGESDLLMSPQDVADKLEDAGKKAGDKDVELWGANDKAEFARELTKSEIETINELIGKGVRETVTEADIAEEIKAIENEGCGGMSKEQKKWKAIGKAMKKKKRG